jgi:hypothetical protein
VSRKKHGGGKRRKALGHDEPFRTCVACRTSAPRAEVLRFARAPDGAVGFDVRAALDGRGAWTCAQAVCIQKAVEKGGFARAFEEPVLADGPGLVAQVRRTLAAEVEAGLGIVRRAGALAAGRDEVARALAEVTVPRDRPVAVVLAADLSERTVRDVQGVLQAHEGLGVLRGPPMADIGRAIGRKPTGVLLVRGTPRAALLIDDLRRFERLGRLAEPPQGA